MTLELNQREYEGAPVIELKGKLTLGEGARSLRKLIEDLAAAGRKNVLFDLAAVSYMDSTGLGTLVACHNILKPHGVTLIRVPARIQELLVMSRLSGIFPVYQNEADAITKSQPLPPG